MRNINIKYKLQKAISAPDFIRIFILRTIGNFLILSSLFMLAKTFYLPVKEEIRFFIDNKIQKQYIVTDVKDIEKAKRDYSATGEKGLLSRVLNLKNVEVLVPQDPEFSIVIPKIGANAKIISNVNPGVESVYLQALKSGVAHALGTSFPGENGHVFLFAHSTDYFWNVGTYNAVFYLLYKLEVNDEVNLFYQGKRYRYQVAESRIVNPNEVEYLTRKTDKEFLTLQTCWPPGTTLKRLLVFAKRIIE